MRWKSRGFLTVLAAGALLWAAPAAGESAIAFSPDVQTYGYCYDISDANLCAEKYCYEGSGQACQTRFRSTAAGFFSLALGNRGWGVGYSVHDGTAAGQNAMNQCIQQTQGCRVVETWKAEGKN